MFQVAAIFLVSLTSAFAQYYQPAPTRVAYPVPNYVGGPKYAAPVAVSAPLARSANPEAGASITQEYRDVSFDGNFNYG